MKRHPHKKLYAALITALCAAPFAAQADEATYKIYGKARMSVDMTDHGSKDVTSVSSNSSRLGFKGVEDLGNGLRAIFQIETLVNMDNGTGDSIGADGLSTTTGTGTLFGSGRNSYVGIAGGFGTVVLGITDNAYKLATSKLDISSDSMGDFNAIIGNVSGASTPFNEREPNGVNYWSPKMNGFQVLAAYRLGEDAAENRDRYSLAGVYENGPYYASLAYELHRNEATTAGAISSTPTAGTHIDDTHAWTAGLGYMFNEDKTKVNFVYEKLAQDDRSTLIDRSAWYLAMTHKIDANTLKIAYARAGDNDAASDTGANWYLLGLDHSLSKRTTVYALYAKTENESGAKYGLGTGGSSGAAKSGTAGLDLSTFSIGINHDF